MHSVQPEEASRVLSLLRVSLNGEDARKDSLDEGRWEIGPIAAAAAAIAATAVIANLDTQTRG